MRTLLAVIACLFLATQHAAYADDAVPDLLRQAEAALAQGKTEAALDLAGKAITSDPRNVAAYEFRGKLYGSLGRHAEAVADFTQALTRDPLAANIYNRRGAEHFKLGHIAEAIKDFDKFVELKPGETPGHWMRGIAYYYAGRFADGRRQFAAYEKIDANDVENAVWHYICNARLVGAEKARAELLKVGRDGRVPMMQVYALFQGRSQPADVLSAAQAAGTAERKHALFLADLYLGLYYEIARDPAKARIYMARAAAAASVGGYMGDVARVHLALREWNHSP